MRLESDLIPSLQAVWPVVGRLGTNRWPKRLRAPGTRLIGDENSTIKVGFKGLYARLVDHEGRLGIGKSAIYIS